MTQLLKFLFIIWVLTIPLLIVGNTVCMVTDSSPLYGYGFDKYHISERTEIDQHQLEKVAKILIEYFDDKVKTPQLIVTNIKGTFELYNSKELIHLEDVKKIIELFRIVQIISGLLFVLLGILILLKMGTYKLLKGLQLGSLILLGTMAILVVWSLIDFDSLFYLFHIVSFSNNLWILDPSRDYLIMMFPEGFFYDAAIFLITVIILQCVILCLPAFVMELVKRKKNKVEYVN